MVPVHVSVCMFRCLSWAVWRSKASFCHCRLEARVNIKILIIIKRRSVRLPEMKYFRFGLMRYSGFTVHKDHFVDDSIQCLPDVVP